MCHLIHQFGEGESFIIAMTRRPVLMGGVYDVFEPIVIEYNPKAVW
ncbi:hypothetical protein [Cytobacillus oceanisediminis]